MLVLGKRRHNKSSNRNESQNFPHDRTITEDRPGGCQRLIHPIRCPPLIPRIMQGRFGLLTCSAIIPAGCPNSGRSCQKRGVLESDRDPVAKTRVLLSEAGDEQSAVTAQSKDLPTTVRC